MRNACLLSHRSEDVSIFFGRASVHCEDLLDLVLLRIARGYLLNSLVASKQIRICTVKSSQHCVFFCSML
jgi:hypothetical protein